MKTPKKKQQAKAERSNASPVGLEKGALPARAKSTKPSSVKGFFVVGIGSSAGGLEALEQFFTHMPPDSGMAFVLIPHLDPTHKSMMPDLLKRYTKMPISEAEDGMEVKPNSIYIISPNKDMSILNRRLQLLEPVERRGFRHPIDFFFRALAQDQGEKAVAVVLSGTGTEGALGLKAVKSEGGLVLVQDPKDAKYDGMPSSAIATRLVDYVLAAAEMPGQLLGYIRRIGRRPFLPAAVAEAKPIEPLQKIFVLIRAKTGHDFSLYKQNTILRRLERRMAIHKIRSLANYVFYLRHNPEEIEVLFKELLIRVTNLFRDGEAFDAVMKDVLPLITQSKSFENPLRIWVPGCSTGEEAYSLAIIIHEYMQKSRQDFKVQIFGTDIDADAIDAARVGDLLEKILPDSAEFHDFEIDRDFPGIGRKKLLLNARRIFQKGIGTETILLDITDITRRRS
ncbi:MAG: chemotaxis protein CheB [Thermodesulfovibrionales bacterium]|jgi:two-component system CheB/CheR fusion protein